MILDNQLYKKLLSDDNARADVIYFLLEGRLKTQPISMGADCVQNHSSRAHSIGDLLTLKFEQLGYRRYYNRHEPWIWIPVAEVAIRYWLTISISQSGRTLESTDCLLLQNVWNSIIRYDWRASHASRLA
jgi:hypothetical protein